jgi:hypothetical protein
MQNPGRVSVEVVHGEQVSPGALHRALPLLAPYHSYQSTTLLLVQVFVGLVRSV